jgi:Putative prokaryotic signal transducing protein
MERLLECVFVANGEAQAQQVRAFLAADGIESVERGEALRKTHGFTLDGLGRVEIYVAEDQADRARELLRAAEDGSFRLADDVEQ